VTEEQVSELIVVEEMGAALGKPRRSDELDVNVSSERQSNLKNNGIRCSMNENISKRRVAPPILPPAVRTICVPDAPKPTHSKMRNDPHGPPTAVFSIPPRSHEESCPRRVEDGEPCRNDDGHGSVNKSVSTRWIMYSVLSLMGQVEDLPVVQNPTRSTTRIVSSYSPQTAVSSTHPRFGTESCGCRSGLGTKLGQIDNIRCSVKDNVSKRGTVPKALSPHIQVAYLPVVHSPTCSQTRSNPYGSKTAVSFNIPRSHRRSRDCGLEVSIRRSSDAIHVKRSNDPTTTVLSTTPQFHRELSSRPLGGIKLHHSDEAYCSARRLVNKRWTVPTALSSHIQVTNIPVFQDQMRSRTHYDSSYGPQTAVFSVHQRFPAESCHRCLDGVESCQKDELSFSAKENISRRQTVPLALSSHMQVTNVPVFQAVTCSPTRNDLPNDRTMAISSILRRFPKDSRRRHLGDTQGCHNDERHRSVKKDVSKRRTVPMALSPTIQVRDSPVSQVLTRPQMRYKSLYGPQVAVPSIHPRFPRESCRSRHLDGIESCQNDELGFSVKKNISNRRTVPPALFPDQRVVDLPVSQIPTRLKRRIRHSYGPKKAAASTNRRCPRSSRHRRLVVLRRRRHDAVHVKRSISNAISKSKSNALLVFDPDPSKHAYSPCTVTVTPHDDGSPEKVHEKLRMCYPLRKKREQRARRSPVWCERVLTIARQVGTKVTCHITTLKHVHAFAWVLTTCRVKWYVLNQVHRVLLGALLFYVPYHWPGRVGTHKVTRLLLCSILSNMFSLLSFPSVTQLLPYNFCVIATDRVRWISLSEFPESYSASTSISLCIDAQGLLPVC
jgi:hypothetical protein